MKTIDVWMGISIKEYIKKSDQHLKDWKCIVCGDMSYLLGKFCKKHHTEYIDWALGRK